MCIPSTTAGFCTISFIAIVAFQTASPLHGDEQGAPPIFRPPVIRVKQPSRKSPSARLPTPSAMTSGNGFTLLTPASPKKTPASQTGTSQPASVSQFDANFWNSSSTAASTAPGTSGFQSTTSRIPARDGDLPRPWTPPAANPALKPVSGSVDSKAPVRLPAVSVPASADRSLNVEDRRQSLNNSGSLDRFSIVDISDRELTTLSNSASGSSLSSSEQLFLKNQAATEFDSLSTGERRSAPDTQGGSRDRTSAAVENMRQGTSATLDNETETLDALVQKSAAATEFSQVSAGTRSVSGLRNLPSFSDTADGNSSRMNSGRRPNNTRETSAATSAAQSEFVEVTDEFSTVSTGNRRDSNAAGQTGNGNSFSPVSSSTMVQGGSAAATEFSQVSAGTRSVSGLRNLPSFSDTADGNSSRMNSGRRPNNTRETSAATSAAQSEFVEVTDEFSTVSTGNRRDSNAAGQTGNGNSFSPVSSSTMVQGGSAAAASRTAYSRRNSLDSEVAGSGSSPTGPSVTDREIIPTLTDTNPTPLPDQSTPTDDPVVQPAFAFVPAQGVGTRTTLENKIEAARESQRLIQVDQVDQPKPKPEPEPGIDTLPGFQVVQQPYDGTVFEQLTKKNNAATEFQSVQGEGQLDFSPIW